jgi:hypothetical protein
MDCIWNALHAYRFELIPEGDAAMDEEWSELCTAMAWLREELELEEELDQ